jgi:hypothetical protein
VAYLWKRRYRLVQVVVFLQCSTIKIQINIQVNRCLWFVFEAMPIWSRWEIE